MNTGWRDVRLRHLFARRDVTNRPDLQLLSVYRDLGVVPRDGREDNYNKPGEDLSAYRVVQPGDVVLNKMKTWQGSIGISDHGGIVSPAYFVARPLTDDDPRFLHHLLRSQPLVAEYGAQSKGIRPSQWDLPWDAFQDIRVALPPLDEQRVIADYLDRETARFDALIAAKGQLLSLAEERFSSLLTLHIFSMPSAPHAPLKRLATCLPGFAFPSDSFVEETGEAVRLLRGANVTPSGLRWDDTVWWPGASVTSRIAAYRLERDDLVIGMDRPWIVGGIRVSKIGIDDLPCLLVQRVARIRPRRGSDVDYIRYALRSQEFRDYFAPITTGVSVPHISDEQIMAFTVPATSAHTQHQIAHELRREETALSDLHSRLTSQAALLHERRQALITAAVTGQIEVPVAA